jgi:hypothetical protein
LPGLIDVNACGHDNHRANDTGIEWVSCWFSSSQFGLSSSFSVFLVYDESSPDLYKRLWYDLRVTATATENRSCAEVIR